MPLVVHTGLAMIIDEDRVRCVNCDIRVPPEKEYYHCLECKPRDNGDLDDGYNLCVKCAKHGQVCINARQHNWVMSRIDEKGTIVRGRETMAYRVQDAYKSYPSIFHGPHGEIPGPEFLFEDEHRFISKRDPRQILIYTDGACGHNGQGDSRGGCCFVYRPSAYSKTGELTHAGTILLKLEEKGPDGCKYVQTSNRAELRAAIAALQFRDWSTDCNHGWKSIVIATDSEYVALGATDWIKSWESNNWMLFSENNNQWQPPKNLDLWKLLLHEIRKLQGLGVSIFFWKIPRKWNERADTFAKKAVGLQNTVDFLVAKADGPKEYKYVPYV